MLQLSGAATSAERYPVVSSNVDFARRFLIVPHKPRIHAVVTLERCHVDLLVRAGSGVDIRIGGPLCLTVDDL